MKTSKKGSRRDRRRVKPNRSATSPGRPAQGSKHNKGKDAQRAREERPVPPPSAMRKLRRLRLTGLVVLGGVFVWAYWPTLVELVRAWDREPDYSHGFLVAPLALFFMWSRRDSLPGLARSIAWGGLLLLACSVALRFGAAALYLEPVDGWSILLWVAGIAWLLGGWRFLMWASPSILFLFFLVPLPYRAERLVSYPLQRIATKFSCWTLQSLGQPAIAEGNTILLGDHHLEVEEACSGLRIFVGIVALAFAYVIVARRTWWEKLLLLASTVPIALIANATRVVVTGLLSQLVSSEAGAKFTHDLAGWGMILLAAALFGVVLWYIGKLFPEGKVFDIRSVVRAESGQRGSAQAPLGSVKTEEA